MKKITVIMEITQTEKLDFLHKTKNKQKNEKKTLFFIFLFDFSKFTHILLELKNHNKSLQIIENS